MTVIVVFLAKRYERLNLVCQQESASTLSIWNQPTGAGSEPDTYLTSTETNRLQVFIKCPPGGVSAKSLIRIDIIDVCWMHCNISV